MAKTNFTKAEEALAESLQKIAKDQLLEQATAAKGGSSITSAEATERIHISNALKRTLKRLYRTDKEVYKKLGLKKKGLDKLMDAAIPISSDELSKLHGIKSKVDEYLKTLPATSTPDDKLIESERHKHINKRFNVSDKWLPLT